MKHILILSMLLLFAYLNNALANNCRNKFKGLNDADTKQILGELLSKSDSSKLAVHASPKKLKEVQLGEIGQRILNRLNQLMVGQPRLKQSLAENVQRAAFGANNNNKVVATYLLSGVTGTGKTLIAQALNEAIGFDPKEVTTISGGEFQFAHDIAKLTGSPAGYIGHGKTEALITQEMLTQRTSEKYNVNVVVVDELEKAHESLLKLLLGIIENGELTTATNTKIDFTKTIIIMTTNKGQSAINSVLNENNKFMGFQSTEEVDDTNRDERISDAVDNSIKTGFSPEFLNRIDQKFTFKPYNEEEVADVLNMVLAFFQRKSFSSVKGNQILFNLTPKARQLLIDTSYEKEYGGRSLRRAVENQIITKLSNAIASNQISDGDLVSITVNENNEALEFNSIASNMTEEDQVEIYNKIYGNEVPSLTEAFSKIVQKESSSEEDKSKANTSTKGISAKDDSENERKRKEDVATVLKYYNTAIIKPISDSFFINMVRDIHDKSIIIGQPMNVFTNFLNRVFDKKYSESWPSFQVEPLVVSAFVIGLTNIHYLDANNRLKMHGAFEKVNATVQAFIDKNHLTGKQINELWSLINWQYQRIMNLPELPPHYRQ